MYGGIRKDIHESTTRQAVGAKVWIAWLRKFLSRMSIAAICGQHFSGTSLAPSQLAVWYENSFWGISRSCLIH